MVRVKNKDNSVEEDNNVNRVRRLDPIRVVEV